jgi:hypothetical protein
MAIKAKYNFNGIEIQDAIIRINRLWGSSKDGWTALVGVYIKNQLPAKEAFGVEVNEDYQPATEATTELALITEFNRFSAYNDGERGYVSLYNLLTKEFDGVEC